MKIIISLLNKNATNVVLRNISETKLHSIPDDTPAGHQEIRSQNVTEGDELSGIHDTVEGQHTQSLHLGTPKSPSLPVAERSPQMQSG